MLHRILTIAALAAVVVSTACSDRTPVNPAGDAALTSSATPEKPEKLARQLAKALGNPVFRAYVKAQLDASPFREHKLQFQSFLGASGGRALRYLEEGAEQEAKAAIPLEIYFPVPAHRAAWTGDDNLLVATGITDRDVPVAFDVRGGRHLLDPDTPPETPVLALVPVETDFSVVPARQTCLDCGGGSGDLQPPPAPPPGLYMTKAHFVQDFEGWLKGAPEFEVHILGQSGQSDSLMSYQCAGERQNGPYFFNQDDLDWSGQVLLFSKQQLDEYNAAHPGQNVRVFVVEDDDTACIIKTDPQRFQNLISAVDSVYQRYTSGNDSSTTDQKAWGYAKAAYNIWQALAHWIKSDDELVGNAVEDSIVGAYYPGYNWFVKADNNITNGWINLVMY